MGQIIDGKLQAQKYKERIIQFINDRIKNGLRVPCMVSLMVGNDGGSKFYLDNQRKVCEKLGIKFESITMNEETTESEIVEVITKLNVDNNVDGIMLQLPLPKHINEKNVTSSINSEKDIDSLTYENTGKFYRGEKAFVPCTPKGIIELIKSTGINISGKNAVVIGRSNIVGKPVFQLLLNENATVTVCHSKTENLEEVCASADILVSAIGKPHFVNKNFVKKGAIVIDVGTTVVDGKLKGDVDFNDVIDKAAFVTPVPGGVGSMTTTMLALNVCEALK
ncbi:tetrahydrofolate dehydrogenase/cyclohydrolase catalytic domain-containing protein [Clostridium hydrogenum]|uniref:tetrahydrofolate dehydrogenase/cyclohydrolase catalytic domain-containing protein n=1 Tax=Clostridium hydrogenum TaxID=2855764 RepID=UPI001F3760EE|nr:tetrahydrofolate dehydrogenase/cyclohydrolase catalytic domain-containing protein [Clostridium hydrogenum]